MSTSRAPVSPGELQILLAKSRANNVRAKVTGVLLYHQGLFLQVLEGEAKRFAGEVDPVAALFTRISADPRHHHLTVLRGTERPHRTFGDWAMGGLHLDETVAHHPGLKSLLVHGEKIPQADPAGFAALLEGLEGPFRFSIR